MLLEKRSNLYADKCYTDVKFPGLKRKDKIFGLRGIGRETPFMKQFISKIEFRTSNTEKL